MGLGSMQVWYGLSAHLPLPLAHRTGALVGAGSHMTMEKAL